MGRYGTTRAALAAATTLAFALLIGSAAEASPSAVVTHDVAGSPADVRDYWTPERMRNAEPLDLRAGDGSEAPVASAAAISPDQEIPAGQELLYPYRLHGRLFLVIGGQNASCSATVITSFTRDLVMTAGHCVAEPAGGGQIRFASNVLFVPGYRDGATPYGSFVGTNAGAPTGWAAVGNIAFDVGVVKLAPQNGSLIQDLLGSRGITFNKPDNKFKGKTFQLFGYPAAPAPSYDGRFLILCNSGFEGFEAFTGSPVTFPCHQQEGASGGGWMLGKLLTSITSHSACATPGPTCAAISGTYLGSAALQVWAGLSGGLPKGVHKKIKRCKKVKGKKHVKCLNKAETFQPVVR